MTPPSRPAPALRPTTSTSLPESRALRFELVGLDCCDCAATLEHAIVDIAGVRHARLDFATARLEVWTDDAPQTERAVVAAIGASGYAARSASGPRARVRASGLIRSRRDGLTVVAGLALASGWLLEVLLGRSGLASGSFLVAILLAGESVARAAWLAVHARRALDMNVLMTVAAAGALAIGEWSEAATAMVLFGLGRMLEGHTTDRARSAIRDLMGLAPSTALVRRDGRDALLPVEDVRLDDLVVVRAGDRVPVDGTVVGGASSVSESVLTGESMPVDKGLGDTVHAGTINGTGVLEVRVTSLAGDTVVARIAHLVETAQASRASAQRFVDRFASTYTPLVIVAAALLAALGPLVTGQSPGAWLHRALVLLVIACPCALVLSTPVSIVSAIAAAARRNVLIKGGTHLEAIGAADFVAIDKTGTLTEGRPEVTDVIALDDGAQDAVLALAAAVESRSEHPLGRIIAHEARHRGLAVPEAEAFQSLPGRGAQARVHGRLVTVGVPRSSASIVATDAMARAVTRLERQGKTVALVVDEGRVVGAIGLADRLRPEAAEAMASLRAAGIRRLVMLTGDNPTTARAIADRVGISDVRAGLLPADKADAVRALSASGTVAMIGDGVNDAPALAAAAVGVALTDGRTVGSDAALETADIVLMGADLGRLAYAVELGRRTRRTIAANIAFSLAVKGAFLALAVSGAATLWMAVLADVGTSLVVILNGMRLLDRRDGLPSLRPTTARRP